MSSTISLPVDFLALGTKVQADENTEPLSVMEELRVND